MAISLMDSPRSSPVLPPRDETPGTISVLDLATDRFHTARKTNGVLAACRTLLAPTDPLATLYEEIRTEHEKGFQFTKTRLQDINRLKKTITSLDKQLDALERTIDSDEEACDQYEQKLNELEDARNQFLKLVNIDNFYREYNARVDTATYTNNIRRYHEIGGTSRVPQAPTMFNRYPRDPKTIQNDLRSTTSLTLHALLNWELAQFKTL